VTTPPVYWYDYGPGDSAIARRHGVYKSLALAVSEALAYSRSIPRWGVDQKDCWVHIYDEKGPVGRVNWYWSQSSWQNLRKEPGPLFGGRT